MLLQNCLLGDRHVDIRVLGGRYDTIVDAAAPLTPLPGEEVLYGGMVTPPFAEPHTHLDVVLLGRRVANRSGTLSEGIAAWASLRDGLTREDVQQRARTVLSWYVGWGTLRVRTHVDTGNLTAVAAMIELREALKTAEAPAELQVVAFPQEGILRSRGARERWEEAVAMGCDAVGAIPHFERTAEEGWASVRLAFELAAKRGLAVDLHCDETDDPGSRNLEVVCAEAIDRGYGELVVAGHCTALHSYPNPYAAKVIDLVAASGVQVVTNPLDNAVLQGRYDSYPRRRGLTRVDELWAAGASVGIGHDSVVDPFYRLGTANLLDAAYVLIHLGHLTGEDEMFRVFRALHHDNHRPWGGPPPIAIGSPATFLWHPVPDPIEAIRLRRRPRVFVDGTEVLAAGP